MRDKVQVKVLRKRLKLSDAQFANVVRKSGNSISAIVKEAALTEQGDLGEAARRVVDPGRRGSLR